MVDNVRTEEHKVSGEGLVARVRELIREGNVRRIIIKNDEDPAHPRRRRRGDDARVRGARRDRGTRLPLHAGGREGGLTGRTVTFLLCFRMEHQPERRHADS